VSDWIEHDGGPQPVADDVWVHVVDPIEGDYQNPADGVDWPNVFENRVLNQPLIDTARLEGIRDGLEAAHMAVWMDQDWEDVIEVAEVIRALDPATIAKEAAR